MYIKYGIDFVWPIIHLWKYQWNCTNINKCHICLSAKLPFLIGCKYFHDVDKTQWSSCVVTDFQYFDLNQLIMPLYQFYLIYAIFVYFFAIFFECIWFIWFIQFERQIFYQPITFLSCRRWNINYIFVQKDVI